MPELPEVEVTRISLADRLRGARVLSAHLGKTLRWPLGCRPAALQGLSIGELARRGKYLWMPLQGPQRRGGLLLHLGMSGSLALHQGQAPPRGAHDHFELVTDAGTLRLTDPRRFGAVMWSASPTSLPVRALLERLGAEPFDPALTAAAFHAACRGRRASIKSALLAGDLVVGAGNIYACEALFRAGIDPRARCDRLSLPRCTRLLASLRDTLSEAITLGGSTLRDFRDGHGAAGVFQNRMQVYGRAGLPCPRCSTPIRRVVQGQRSTFFCPDCQKR